MLFENRTWHWDGWVIWGWLSICTEALFLSLSWYWFVTVKSINQIVLYWRKTITLHRLKVKGWNSTQHHNMDRPLAMRWNKRATQSYSSRVAVGRLLVAWPLCLEFSTVMWTLETRFWSRVGVQTFHRPTSQQERPLQTNTVIVC